MMLDGCAVVAIWPKTRLMEGSLASRDLEAVVRWVDLNREALMGFWEGKLDSGDLAERLVRV